MKINSTMVTIVVISFVAVISYYAGSSKRNTYSAQQPEPKFSASPAKNNPNQNTASRISSAVVEPNKEDTTASKRIEEIEAEYEQKKQETEVYYADKFRQLQQTGATASKKLDAADRAAYAQFVERLNNTVSTHSGYGSVDGYVSPYGNVSAYGWYNGTTSTRVAGAPAAGYRQQVNQLNKARDNLMHNYEVEYEHLQKQRANTMGDLERNKELAIASVRSVSAHRDSTVSYGIVTGILFERENPYGRYRRESS